MLTTLSLKIIALALVVSVASATQTGWTRTSGRVTHVQNNASVISYQGDRIRSLVRFHSLAGSAGAPTYTFDNNTTTGLYSTATGTLGFAASGLEVFTASSTAIELKKQLLAQGGNQSAFLSFYSWPILLGP